MSETPGGRWVRFSDAMAAVGELDREEVKQLEQKVEELEKKLEEKQALELKLLRHAAARESQVVEFTKQHNGLLKAAREQNDELDLQNARLEFLAGLAKPTDIGPDGAMAVAIFFDESISFYDAIDLLRKAAAH